MYTGLGKVRLGYYRDDTICTYIRHRARGKRSVWCESVGALEFAGLPVLTALEGGAIRFVIVRD